MTMTQAERDAWVRADRVLDILLDLPHEARRMHLARLDIDGPLRKRVERLLAAMEDGDGPLDHPGNMMLPPLAEHVLRGRRLGRWALETEIGRGGVAVVYRARSLEGPAGQCVAVKVLALGALADDLRRWLDGRAVRAQPPGPWYRLRKFVGRNRLAVAASLALLLALAAGLAATLWQAGIARQAKLEGLREVVLGSTSPDGAAANDRRPH